jgi:hypothetical protein
LGSNEPNVLGIDNIDDDYLDVLASMLDGNSVGERSMAVGGGDSVNPGSMTQLAGISDSIRNSTLFKSIFLDMPAIR